MPFIDFHGFKMTTGRELSFERGQERGPPGPLLLRIGADLEVRAPRGILIVLALLFFPVLNASAQDTSINAATPEIQATPSQSELLAHIKTQIDEQSLELSKFRVQQKELEKSLTELQHAVQSVKSRRAAVLDEIEHTKRMIDKNDLKVEQTRKAEAASAAAAAERLRAIYMQRGAEQGQIMLAAALSPTPRDTLALDTQAIYLRAIERHDAEAMRELLEIREVLAEQTQAAERLTRDRTVLDEKLEQEEATLRTTVAKQANLVAQAKKQRQQMESSLAALRSQAQRIESIVSSMTGAEPQIFDERPPAPLPEVQPERPSVVEPFVGGGLAGLKGKLGAPVNGQILRKFGKHRVADLKEHVFNKGITFAVNPPGLVQAVAAGKVIFEGRMPIYGIVVILDHGERYYSLYGGLTETQVSRGESVPARANVGKVEAQLDSNTDSNSDSPTLHFEIRKNGSPVNPVGFFRR